LCAPCMFGCIRSGAALSGISALSLHDALPIWLLGAKGESSFNTPPWLPYISLVLAWYTRQSFFSCRTASNNRITPQVLMSTVETGCVQLLPTKLIAARLYTSSGCISRIAVNREGEIGRAH